MKKIIAGTLCVGLTLVAFAKVEAGRKSQELEDGMQEIDASFARSEIVSNGYPCRRITRLALESPGKYNAQCDRKKYYTIISQGSRWSVNER